MENSPLLHILETINLSRILGLFLGLAFLILIVKLMTYWSAALYRRFPTRRLILLQFFTTISFLIYIIGTIGLVYSTFKPTNEMLLAFAGTAAVALGFAIKDFVSSLVAGLILLFDRPFQVGDRISFEGVYGEIRSIGLRAVRIVTLNDDLVTIPNNKFISDKVSSSNFGELNLLIQVFFHISLEEDFDRVRNLIYEVVCTSRYIYLDKPVNISALEVEMMGQLVLKITVKAYAFDVKYEKQFETDLVVRTNKAFLTHKVLRPIPIISDFAKSTVS